MDEAVRSAELEYPFAEPPASGKTMEVADGVLWLRMPLPFRLDHINLYLLRDGDGWTIVDTGIRGRETRDIWETLITDLIGEAPVNRIIATHMHPDHVGQAGWLTRRFKTQLWMSRTEFFMCKMLAVDGPADIPEDALHFYQQAGFDAHQVEYYQQRFGRFGAMIETLPAGYRRLEDREQVDIDGTPWEVVVGRGHSPEHACLYSPERGVLLSGDQVLPRISSNVSVFPTEPAANPLHEWLASCVAIRARLPNHLLVLPSHNLPFKGLHERLTALIDGHVEGLIALHALCARPQRVIDVFPALFKRAINDESMMLATGESRAHINYLLALGALIETLHSDGALRYQSNGPFSRAQMPELSAL